MTRLVCTLSFIFLIALARAEVRVLNQDRSPAISIVADKRVSTGEGPAILEDAADWLAVSLKEASGANFEVLDQPNESPAIVIARADAWPDVSSLTPADGYGAYAISTRSDRVFILGNSEEAARHGVADLLERWGFRWFAPSPRWRVVPQLKEISIDLDLVERPALIDRRIWYAYGMSGDDLKPLMENYTRWAIANRLSLKSPIRTGHSYGNIIQRNKEAFDENPLLSALLENGERDTERHYNARKFCFSNPDLIKLVTEDRRQLLETNRKANPAAFMVSIDPSDGEGTCVCEECKALGTTTDRVIHLANEVARGLRQNDPEAWIGLYAYSSHRLPPTIEVEPNVYVQVAMGFNRTKYSLPELVDRWSKKVGAIGLREYYGVEAWDWGLPGRARGGQVEYHRKWIPFYAERKMNAINAETNANWGAQTLGLYVASQLMWDPNSDVDSIVDKFFDLAFGVAAEDMRRFYDKMEAAPPLRPSTLLPLFKDLNSAWAKTDDQAVRDRLTDLKAYLVYVSKFRDFDLVRSRNRDRNENYYAALEPLMNYAWRIRHRDTIHYYALARRLCNGLPVQDDRLDFYMANKERDPVWMTGDSLTDAEILTLFEETQAALEADDDPTVNFSRYFDPVTVEGEDGGPAGIHADKREAVSRFRRGLLGYLIPSGPHKAKFGIAPSTKPITMTVFMRNDVIFENEFHASDEFQPVEIDLPRAFEYRVEITGDFEIQVPPETPFVFEASVVRPAWIDYSGPHYFYVPSGTRELIVDANPRLSLMIPEGGKRDLHPADRVEGKNHIVVEVPKGADGQMWRTTSLTRGQVSFLNTPPVLSFHRQTVFVPREVSESDGLSTKE